MAVPTNHYKLGLFVITGFALAILAAAVLGGLSFSKDTILYHSYFNESVQGLELGAPVKFRGVTIGHVAGIEIAPDHRMVDVVSELDTTEVKRMGLTEAKRRLGRERFAVPPDLRAQLNSQGITGVKFVAIDFFDVKSNPAPVLPFAAAADQYIPAASSMMKNLEDTITKAMERLPDMVDAVVMIMGRVDGLIATLQAQDVSGKVVTTLSHADGVLTTLQRTLQRIDAQDLGKRGADTITDLDASVDKLNLVLDRIGGERGLLASAQHATDAFGALGQAGHRTQRDLDVTLRSVSEAAEALRSLLAAIERDPDMLLKGKAQRKGAQ